VIKISKNKNPKKSTIHTTISEKAVKIFNKYLNYKNNKGELIYKSKSDILEHALNLLDKYYDPEIKDVYGLWDSFRKDLDMVAVGKTTFLAYISGDVEKAFKENIAIEVIEWYKKKTIDDMELIEILNAIKEIWIAANYFTKVEIEKKDNELKVYFYHNFRSKLYGEFWSKYFTEFLKNRKKCEIKSLIRNESFILNIKEMN